MHNRFIVFVVYSRYFSTNYNDIRKYIYVNVNSPDLETLGIYMALKYNLLSIIALYLFHFFSRLIKA